MPMSGLSQAQPAADPAARRHPAWDSHTHLCRGRSSPGTRPARSSPRRPAPSGCYAGSAPSAAAGTPQTAGERGVRARRGLGGARFGRAGSQRRAPAQVPAPRAACHRAVGSLTVSLSPPALPSLPRHSMQRLGPGIPRDMGNCPLPAAAKHLGQGATAHGGLQDLCMVQAVYGCWSKPGTMGWGTMGGHWGPAAGQEASNGVGWHLPGTCWR